MLKAKDLGTYVCTVDNHGLQTITSERYNCTFNFCNGYSERWGRTKEDNNTPPVLEVIDIEITTKCNGVSGPNGVRVLCPFCYKANGPVGTNMSFETFKELFDKLPTTLAQIAFSADSSLDTNPDTFKIMKYCRENGRNYVVPSISVAQLDEKRAKQLLDVGVGCIGVSLYDNKEVCYDTIHLLDTMIKEGGYDAQVNIQAVVANHNFVDLMGVLDDIKSDPRLSNLECIVYLALKQKGRGAGYAGLGQEKWNRLLDKTSESISMYGVDVCSTKKLAKYFEETGLPGQEDYMETCDAGYYSAYISVNGLVYPCSFLENVDGWEIGEDLSSKSFEEIWGGERFEAYRAQTAGVRCMSCDKSCVFWEI